jgi:hypothetical protein
MKKKKCSRCKVYLEATTKNFYKDRKTNSGFRYECITCTTRSLEARRLKQYELKGGDLDDIKKIMYVKPW